MEFHAIAAMEGMGCGARIPTAFIRANHVLQILLVVVHAIVQVAVGAVDEHTRGKDIDAETSEWEE